MQDAYGSANSATRKAKQKLLLTEISTEIDRLQAIVGIERIDPRVEEETQQKDELTPFKYWPFATTETETVQIMENEEKTKRYWPFKK